MLRKRSMELWEEWIAQLKTKENPLIVNKPLIQLASSEKEASLMAKLFNDRQDLGLELLPPSRTIKSGRSWPENHYGGLISHQDGRINPIQLQQCLLHAIEKCNVHKICETVIRVDRLSSTKDRQWRLHLSDSTSLTKQIIIICAALGTEKLLNPLGYRFPIDPILGQVLKLELKTNDNDWSDWPAVLCYEGINLIPDGTNCLLMGATLEPGTYASSKALEQMKSMNGSAPDWIRHASIAEHWSGLRGRPANRTAPILQTLEPGLIIATGHYRNGILLAPVSAEWVAKEVMTTERESSI